MIISPGKSFSCRIFTLNLLFYNRSASVWKGFDVRTDVELVNAVLDGEKETFAVLVKRYERPVRAVVWPIIIPRRTFHRKPSLKPTSSWPDCKNLRLLAPG